jgi:transposase
MHSFDELTHFGSIDWAKAHHDLCIVDLKGKIVLQLRFEESAEGWASFRDKIKAFHALGIVIETSTGCVVERLLESGCNVYPIQPAAAKSYRNRVAPSGDKNDNLDCYSMARALRSDGMDWHALKAEDPLTLELRYLCRDQSSLIEQRTAFVNQLINALHEYYPAALEAFDDWTRPSAWAFVAKFPTPAALQEAGKRKWEKFLHAHKLARPATYEARLAIFSRAHEFRGSQPTTDAKKVQAQSLVVLLQALEARLNVYDELIQALYYKHPDRKWFGSLPIAQDGKTAPRLLAEIGSDPERFPDAKSLQCLAGTAPVRFQSGCIDTARIRRACNKHLRFSIHWFADLSRHRCPWAETYYQKKRSEGKGHSAALRCLGQRWLKIIWKMRKTKTAYDPELHQKNQLKHGSWVLQLLAPTRAAKATPN